MSSGRPPGWPPRLPGPSPRLLRLRVWAAATGCWWPPPFGSDWYRYFMRRLAERPANVGFVLRNLVRR
jgi:hypothetical protein